MSHTTLYLANFWFQSQVAGTKFRRLNSGLKGFETCFQCLKVSTEAEKFNGASRKIAQNMFHCVILIVLCLYHCVILILFIVAQLNVPAQVDISRPVVLNLVGGTEPHKFYTCIHQALRSWKNRMRVVHFFFLLSLLKISCHRTPETDSQNP